MGILRFGLPFLRMFYVLDFFLSEESTTADIKMNIINVGFPS